MMLRIEMQETGPDQPPADVCATGIAGLDHILRGGFPRNRFYLIQGNPGVGKTTLALQFLLEGIRVGERCLYITLSETREEFEQVARSHGWPVEKLAVLELSTLNTELSRRAQNTLFHTSEIELSETVKLLLNEVERVNPQRVVFDSLTELRLLAESALRYRHQLIALKQFFAGRKITALLLDDQTSEMSGLEVQTIAYGVVQLQLSALEYGAERRRLNVTKLRGVPFLGGYHDYAIHKGGLKIYPRLVRRDLPEPIALEQVTTGVSALDALLGGGIERGTSTLFTGPPGAGKSSLASKVVTTAAERGERSVIYSFDESLEVHMVRSSGMGIKIREYFASGLISIQQVAPAELSPNEFACNIRDAVERDGARMIVIDSLNGYLNAMPNEKHLALQLHEVLSYLRNAGVCSLLTLAQPGMLGPHIPTEVDVSYLADTVITLRYFENRGVVKNAIAVIKKRSGFHERTIREMHLSSDGISIGLPLKDFDGILTGVPTFHGDGENE
ncbi:MAG: AAA family ATPase [Verrucomicrobiota bacterium]|nr:AAA family ATPase [Verrucomicrobiota bacterium]